VERNVLSHPPQALARTSRPRCSGGETGTEGEEAVSERPAVEPSAARPERRDDGPPGERAGQTPPGRAERDPDEGPGDGGGSALAADEPAAEEEVGGGD
jgi:hypothetical protein